MLGWWKGTENGGLRELLFQNFLYGLRKTATSSIRIVDVPAEVLTEHLQNTHLDR
jgi:hypothetical protein